MQGRALLGALMEIHFEHNDTLSAAQYEEMKMVALHESPPVMFYLEEGKMVELVPHKPDVMSIEELAERELADCID